MPTTKNTQDYYFSRFGEQKLLGTVEQNSSLIVLTRVRKLQPRAFSLIMKHRQVLRHEDFAANTFR